MPFLALASGGTAALLAAMVVVLLVERRQRVRAQASLAERLRLEQLIADISGGFAGLPRERIDERIREGLTRIAAHLGVGRVSLWRFRGDGRVVSRTHSFRKEGLPARASEYPGAEFPVSIERARRGEIVTLSADEAPAGDTVATVDEATFARTDLRWLAIIPVALSGEAFGALTAADEHRRQRLSEGALHGLRALAEVFSKAVQRKEAEEAIAERDALNEAILASLPGFVAILDGDGAILRVNRAWSALDESHPMAALREGDSYLAAARAGAERGVEAAAAVLELLERALGEEGQDGVIECACGYAEDRFHEVRVSRLDRPGGGAVVAHVDISDRKRAEREARRALGELAHVNRLAFMNELGTSIAHEVNQPLAAIMANAEAARALLARDPPDVAEAAAALNDIVDDNRRAGTVIRRMRALLRKGEPQDREEDLSEVVREVAHTLANEAALREARLDVALPPEPLPVRGDAVQLQQVVINLVMNALDAVATRPARERRVAILAAAREDRRVALMVEDSGPGVDPAHLGRIFDPFFTTKPHGLGMGLSICRSIAEAHGGSLLAEGVPGGGARFRFTLPAAD